MELIKVSPIILGLHVPGIVVPLLESCNFYRQPLEPLQLALFENSKKPLYVLPKRLARLINLHKFVLLEAVLAQNLFIVFVQFLQLGILLVVGLSIF